MLVKRMSMVTPQVRGTTSSLPCHATHSNRNKTSGTRRRNGGGVLGWKRRQGHHDRYTNAFLMRAKEGEDQDELYDYGTEKVRNLLKRDSKELRGIEELGETAQAYQPSNSVDEREEVETTPEQGKKDGANPVQSPFGGASGSPKTPQSPFGASSGRPKPQSPFGAASPSPSASGSSSSSSSSSDSNLSSLSKQKLMSPFKYDAQEVDVQDMSDMGTDRPWWQPQITLTQIVLALSFSLLVVIMLATFSVVLKSGAIRLNT